MKRTFILLGLTFFLLSLQAQNVTNVVTIDSIADHFTKSIERFRQEKVYLHLDRSDYISGEKIWFKAYLTDAALHEKDGRSKFVYVELINPLDSIVSRLKIKSENEIYHGQIPLPEYLPEGNYKIRAYTQYMRNIDEDFFFSKYIHIGHPRSASFKVETLFSSAGEQKVNAEIRITDVNTDSLISPEAKIKLNQLSEKKLKPSDDGILRFNLNLPKNKQNNTLLLDFTYHNKSYNKYIPVSIPDEQFDVSFFPSGGYLVAGNSCIMAFKAIGSNGLHTDVKGELYDDQNRLISEFESHHLGMGYIALMPEAGKSYYAICKNSNNIPIRVDLPKPETNICVLNVNVIEQQKALMISLNSNKASNDDVYLLIHVRGMIQYAKKWDFSKKTLQFDLNSSPAGVLHLILLNSKYEPISEQLAFNTNLGNDKVNVHYQTDKPNYTERELIKNQIQLSDIKDFPFEADCSVSITDSKDVTPDSTTNILIHYLLTSDLKGYIENPAYYFKDDIGNKKRLNLLMMTQGWRRHRIADLIRNDSTPTPYKLEQNQKISGTVKGGLLSKPVKNGNITIVSLANNFFHMLQTDDMGNFLVDNIDFPDSLHFYIQANKQNGSDKVEIIVDQEKFPEHQADWVIPDEKKIDKTDQFNQFIAKADLKYTYENGIRIIDLDEVVVKGSLSKSKKQNFNSPYADGDNVVTEEDLEKYHYNNIYQALERIPGVIVSNKKVSIRGLGAFRNAEPLILLDDVQIDDIALDAISIYDVAQIDVYKTARAAIFGFNGANGAISIHTKRGVGSVAIEKYNNTHFKPLGYQLPEEFYSPKYDTPEAFNSTKPDLRTTIYWNPNIQVDEHGMASFEFYAADAATTYDIVLEGIGEDGKIIQYRGTISRNLK